jgi:hypothetical protein
MDTGLIVVLSIGGAALCCSFLGWLGERRARQQSEEDARAFRAKAAQASAEAVVRAEVVRAEFVGGGHRAQDV